MTVYRHTPEMGEISGFGGEYEQGCQDMLEAGVKWLLAQSTQPVDIQYRGLSGVFGLCTSHNEKAQELDEAILGVVDDCSTMMHHAVISRLMYINKNGWDSYVSKLTKRN